MHPQLYPWKLLSVIVAGILNDQQQRVIDYLKEENRVLREQIGSKQIRLTDNQRRRLAVLGKALGRQILTEVCSIVTPDTIIRWHRKLIANKYDGSKSRRLGRPRVMQEIRQLVVRFALENRLWGYERIEGELGNQEAFSCANCVSCSTIYLQIPTDQARLSFWTLRGFQIRAV